jgi:hypothetical protein
VSPLRFVLALAAALFSTGCGAPAPIAVDLGWRFADGRRCAEAGASTVTVAADCGSACGGSLGFPLTLSCPTGDAGAHVSVLAPGEANLLHLAAVSPAGDTLYRGDLALPAPADATALLYFTGGQ